MTLWRPGSRRGSDLQASQTRFPIKRTPRNSGASSPHWPQPMRSDMRGDLHIRITPRDLPKRDRQTPIAEIGR